MLKHQSSVVRQRHWMHQQQQSSMVSVVLAEQQQQALVLEPVPVLLVPDLLERLVFVLLLVGQVWMGSPS